MSGVRKTLFLLVAVAALAVAPFVGMEWISPAQLGHDALARTIFFDMRLPRLATAFVAGGSLALCGLMFQALFRNPLADPFTLGIASGASCGAAAMILAGVGGTILGVPPVTVGAFVGATLAMSLVGLLTRLKGTGGSALTLLLAGVGVSFLFSSVLMFMQYLSDQRDSFQILRWLMGGIELFGFGPLLRMLPWVLVGCGGILLFLPRLDQLLAGEDLAHSRGVPVVATRRLLLAAATLVVGAVVATCGPIGFVGLMAPHICKALWPLNHRWLGPLSFLVGGVFLALCDTLARTVVAPAEMPVGVITALLGGPFFLWILFVSKTRSL